MKLVTPIRTAPISDELRELAGRVEELEDDAKQECAECATHVCHVDPELEWASEELEALTEKLRDYRRGIATLDEVYEQAGIA